VSTQRDTEEAALIRERNELATMPVEEEAELAALYEERGLSPELARQVAAELSKGDALRAHAEAELHIDPDGLTNPWQAAAASFIAFATGGVLPVAAISVPFDDNIRIIVCVAAVAVGLILTGYVSARLGNAAPKAAVLRNVGIGLLTMLVTWAVGKLTGSVV